MVWKPIEEYRGYEINETGEVLNWVGRPVRPFEITGGYLAIGLSNGGKQDIHVLSRLVLAAFAPRPEQSWFDTPIYLDWNLHNCHIDNLEWRPRWFALKYHKQYDYKNSPKIVDVGSGTIYEDIWHVVHDHGLLYVDVLNSLDQGKPVFPTGQIFQILK